MLVNVTAKLRSVADVGNLVRNLFQTTTEVLDMPIGNLEEEEGFCTLWEAIQEDVSLNILEIKSGGHFFSSWSEKVETQVSGNTEM